MGLADDLRNEFAHLGEGAAATDADIEKVLAAMEAADTAKVEAFSVALDVETKDKKSAKEYVAIAGQVLRAARLIFLG